MSSFEEIQEEFERSEKGRKDFLLAILKTLKLPESVSSDDETGVVCILTYAEEELKSKPQEFQLLLQDLIRHLRESDNTASVNLLNHIKSMGVEIVEGPVGQSTTMSESRAAEHPAANPGPDQLSIISPAARILQKLERSQMMYVIFQVAVVHLLEEDASEEVYCTLGTVLDMAEKRLAQTPSLLPLLLGVTSQLLDRPCQTDTSRQLVEKAINMQQDAGECIRMQVVEEPVGRITTMSESHAAVHPAANPEPHALSTMSHAALLLQTLERSQMAYDNFMDAVLGILELDVSEEGDCVLGMVLEMAQEGLAETPCWLIGVLHTVTSHLLDRPFETDTSRQLVEKAIKMRMDAEALRDVRNACGADTARGENDENVAPGICSELQQLPCAAKIFRVPVTFGGRETRVYLTTDPEAPLIVTLLNGLAVSNPGLRLPGDTAHTISMEDMLEVPIKTWEANLSGMHYIVNSQNAKLMEASADAKDFLSLWEPFANYLDCSVETAINAVGNGQIRKFLNRMRDTLLSKYFVLPTMPHAEEALSNCRRLFVALFLSFEEMPCAHCLTPSQDGPEQMPLKTLDQSGEVKNTDLLVEGACGSVSARAENTTKGLKRKASSEAEVKKEEDRDPATDRTLVKEQDLQGSSHTSPLSAKTVPRSKLPVASPGSEAQVMEGAGQDSKARVLVDPTVTYHAAPGIPMLDGQTYERLKQVYCNQGYMRIFLYTAERQGTLHVMAGLGNDLFVLNPANAQRGGRHNDGPFPRWLRLAWGITYVPCNPKW